MRPPLEANGQIMILQNRIREPLKQLVRLIWVQLINELGRAKLPGVARSNGEQRLPSGNRMGPDDGMDDFQVRSHVQRTASRPFVDLHLATALLSGPEVAVADECGCQAL